MSGTRYVITARMRIFRITSFLKQYLNLSFFFPKHPDMRCPVADTQGMCSISFYCFSGWFSLFIHNVKILFFHCFLHFLFTLIYFHIITIIK